MEFTHHPRWDVWQFDSTRQYQQSVDPTMKPRGFWLGVDGDWKRWVDEEGMGWCEEPAVHFEVDLSKMLVIASNADLLEFHEDSKADEGYPWPMIQWGPTVSNYSGIVIAPHHWASRYGLLWYSSWDCASACVWDLSAIREKVNA